MLFIGVVSVIFVVIVVTVDVIAVIVVIIAVIVVIVVNVVIFAVVLEGGLEVRAILGIGIFTFPRSAKLTMDEVIVFTFVCFE